MSNRTFPRYTAEQSLVTLSGRYRVQTRRPLGVATAVQPQAFSTLRKGKCWCDDPDVSTVCQGGKCHTVPIGLEWSCPGAGLDDFPGGITVGTLGS